MTLTTSCKSCRQTIRFNEWVSDRAELYRKKGETIDLKCKKCGHNDKYHVDSITADTNRLISILSSTIFLLGTPLFVFIIWKNIGKVNYPYAIVGLLAGGVIPFLIYLTINKSDQSRRNMFNRFKVKR